MNHCDPCHGNCPDCYEATKRHQGRGRVWLWILLGLTTLWVVLPVAAFLVGRGQ